MTRQKFLNDYWAYYLMLEERFVHTLNYVELSEYNKNVYSNEYAGLLQLIGSELDAFFKVYCGFSPDDHKNIAHYCTSVLTTYPRILDQEISIPQAEISVKPFEGWNPQEAKQSLAWWCAFDNIKHSRTANKKDASQHNVLLALSALFLLEMKYLNIITEHRDEPDSPDNLSKLFSLKDWIYRYHSGQNLYTKTLVTYN